ncbi:MAG TPA: sarcosine oxidase subunit gamma family protein [Aestuariivirgaceae bacterium]|nr:sarcosine oxidase subunit gamma family protein [Aestuariivirgaceae bacterium]
MAELQFTSALHHRSDRYGAQGLSIALKEIDDRGMVDLRGLASDDRFTAAVKEVLGLELPLAPRTSAKQGDVSVLWLSIDQWLITMARAEASSLHLRLSNALAGVHSLVVDMSDARTILRLEGDNVREVLNKATSVDFTGSDMVQGAVRRLRYAEIAAMVHVISTDPDVVDLYVFRSYADYAWNYLLATAKEAARIKLFGKQDLDRL